MQVKPVNGQDEQRILCAAVDAHPKNQTIYYMEEIPAIFAAL